MIPRRASAPAAAGIEAALRLALAPEIGPVLAHRLLDAFGDAAAVFEASSDELRQVQGLGQVRLASLRDPAVAKSAAAEARRCADAGVDLIAFGDDAYPPLLARLDSPPLVLWVRGELTRQDDLSLAIVGPRAPSQYARLMADALAPPLAAQGLTLVSGLAHGVDAAVHKAALDAGGRTIAVLGQGLGSPIFPEANRQLGDRIAADGAGALLSTFPLETAPSQGLFPLRNEVIAGLSLGTLVIEASETSGALITARHAAAQGRPVMACPGDATRRAARGSNRLLADGAALIQTPEDVLAALGADLRHAIADLPPEPPFEPAPHSAVDQAILTAVADEPIPVDLLLLRLTSEGHASGAVQQRLLLLELDGKIRQLPGRIYAPARRK